MLPPVPIVFVFIVCLAGVVLTVRAVSSRQTLGKLKLGDPIPSVTSENQDGKAVNLAEAGSGRYTLVYFYPKAMTPGCTDQACSLRDAYSELQNKGVRIYGVSLDKTDSLKKFREKEHLPFELLSDRGKKITAAFGVPLILGAFARRQAYLFKNGRLVWMSSKASTDQQAQVVRRVLAEQR